MASRVTDITEHYSLQPKVLWQTFRAQGAAIASIIVYLMFEYVRPQSIYTQLGVLPWTTGTMLLAAVTLLATRKTVRIVSPANGLLVAYTFVVVLSSIAAYDPRSSIGQFDSYFLWIAVYYLIIKIVTTETRVLIMVLAFALYNFKMSLFATRAWVSIGFAFRDWGTGGAPGWFQNSGEFGIEMCVFFPIMLYLALGLRPYLPRWKFVVLLCVAGTALVGMVASSSRGALLGGGAIMLWMILRGKHKIRALMIGAVAAGVLYAVTPPEQHERFSQSGEDKTSQLRLTYWKNGIEMANEFPVLGVGYGNWLPYYRDHFQGRVQVCHNIFVQAASELGYTGLFAFLLLIGCTFVINQRTRTMVARAGPRGHLIRHLAYGFDGALIGYLVSGFFVTVLYYPYFWINLSMTVALNTAAKRLMAGEAPPAPRGGSVRVMAPGGYRSGIRGMRPALPSA